MDRMDGRLPLPFSLQQALVCQHMPDVGRALRHRHVLDMAVNATGTSLAARMRPREPPLSPGSMAPCQTEPASVVAQLLPVDADIVPPVHGVIDKVQRKLLTPR